MLLRKKNWNKTYVLITLKKYVPKKIKITATEPTDLQTQSGHLQWPNTQKYQPHASASLYIYIYELEIQIHMKWSSVP